MHVFVNEAAKSESALIKINEVITLLLPFSPLKIKACTSAATFQGHGDQMAVMAALF